MPNEVATSKSHRLPRFRGVCRESRLRRYFSRTSAATLGLCFAAISPLGLFPTGVLAQEATSGSGGRAAAAPVVVQPGAPGQPTKTLPASTHASLPPLAHSDVEFIQRTILHKSQAAAMISMSTSHTARQHR